MISISINDDFDNTNELVYALQEIIRLIESGYTSGYRPSFTIEGEEELFEDNEFDENI